MEGKGKRKGGRTIEERGEEGKGNGRGEG